MTTLLLVDDQQPSRYSLQLFLEEHGYQVDVASNGIEALAAAQLEPPDLIISEILLPEMDGFALCRLWKQDQVLQNIPFIFYTAAFTDQQDEQFAFNLGANGFLVRPMDPDEFLDKLNEIIQSHAQREVQPAPPSPKLTEDVFYRSYNATLVQKLETKTVELQKKNDLLKRQQSQLELLRRLNLAISQTFDLKMILDLLAEGLMEALAVDRCSIWLLAAGGNYLTGRGYGIPAGQPDVSQILLPRTNPLVSALFEMKRPFVVTDVHDPQYADLVEKTYIESFHIFAFLIVPLIRQDEEIGFLVLDDTSGPHPFLADEVKFVESAATQAVIAIDNARLFTAATDSSDRYHQIFEGMRDAILIEDEAGNLLDVNTSACQMYGYSKEELLKKKVVDLVAPGRRILMHEDLINQERPGEAVETINIRANGEQFPVELTAKIQSMENKPVMLVAVRDISARKAAETRMRLQSGVLRSLANAVIITERDGRITWVNDAFTTLTGYASREVLGQTPRILKSGKHGVAYYQALWETITAGKVWQGKTINRRKDGSLYIDEQTITPLKNQQGEITHFIAVKENVTKREEAAAAVAQYASRLEGLHSVYQAILNAESPEAIAGLTLEHAREMIPCDEIAIITFHLEQQKSVVLAQIGSVSSLEKGSVLPLADFDYTAVTPVPDPVAIDDLAEFPHQSNELAQLSHRGIHSLLYIPLVVNDQLIGIFYMGAIDPFKFTKLDFQISREVASQLAVGLHNATLTAEKQRRSRELQMMVSASADLRQAKDRETMPSVILKILMELFEADGTALAMRDQATAETVMELGLGAWDHWTGQRFPPGAGWTGRVHETGQPAVFQPGGGPAGENLESLGSMTAAACVPMIAHDEIIGALWIGRQTAVSEDDVRVMAAISDMAANAIQRATFHAETRRHAVELEDRVAVRTQELQEAYRRLQELDTLKSKFVSDVSHELRTPITNLTIYLDLLRRGNPAQQIHYLNILQSETDRLRDLVEDILNLSRLELDRSNPPEYEEADLNSLVEEIIEANRPRTEVMGLDFEYQPAPDLPPVLGRPNQLGQVVTNLITNAINYTTNGFIRVRTYQDSGDGRLCLEVTDSGIGIPPEEKTHMFERFYRGSKVAQLNIPGTGLGLAIAHEIVSMHGGTIEVESIPDQGSIFRVWLPAAEAG